VGFIPLTINELTQLKDENSYLLLSENQLNNQLNYYKSKFDAISNNPEA